MALLTGTQIHSLLANGFSTVEINRIQSLVISGELLSIAKARVINERVAQTQTQQPIDHAVPDVPPIVYFYNNPSVQAVPVPDDLEVFFDQMDAGIKKAPSPKKEVTNINPDNPPRMQDLYKYGTLSIRKQESIAFEKKTVLKAQPFQWKSTNGLVGIEIEVENMPHHVPLEAYWSVKGDGSLRNNGVELVSVPLQIKQVQLALEHAYEAMKANNQPDFSNRTSIHIHLNCRDLTQDQLYTLCLLYMIFEKHFFSMVGTKRLNSIFCVPLFRCNIANNINNVIYNFSPSWHKYSALNLLPLVNTDHAAFGTIEFRHLYGTSDQTVILNWINQIVCLRAAALKYKKDDIIQQIKDMNTTSSYLSLFSDVFGDSQLLPHKQDFEDCISNLKRELFKNTVKDSGYTMVEKCDYWNTARSLDIRG